LSSALRGVLLEAIPGADFIAEKERIPYLEGYHPEIQKTNDTIADMFKRVLAVTT
jgi:hypothetical protein